MNGAPTLAWETREPDRIRDLLAVVGFRAGAAGRMTVRGLAIAIVGAAGPDRLRPDPGGGRDDVPEDEPGGTRLLAVGVVTVDLERLAATFPAGAVGLPDDQLLGARAAATSDPRTILLEPATEGRLAATLARHGEGPGALYLDVGPVALAAIRERLLELGELPRAGSGPLGRQLLASTRHRSGPHLLLVAGDFAAGPAGDAWATIEP